MHLDANDPQVALFQQTGSVAVAGYGYRGGYGGVLDFWQPACRVPCDQPLNSNATYSIRGNGIVPSAPFSLPPGAANLTVQAGHIGPRFGGWVLTSLGAGTLIGGIALLATASLFDTSLTDPTFNSSVNTYRIAGGVMIGVGIGSLVGGIVLLVKSRTQVQINGAPLARLRLPGGRSLYANTQGFWF